LRYENELIKSREIVTSSNTTNNPIKTVQQFEKKKDMQTIITKAKSAKTRLKK
jgi:hypothetical protein